MYYKPKLTPKSPQYPISPSSSLQKRSKIPKNNFYQCSFAQVGLNENAPKGFKIEDDPYLSQKLFYRSDNVSFFKKGIVAHSFSTVDMDHQNHYHRVNDEAGIINFKNLTKITNSFAETLDRLMKTNFSPSYHKK